jgi:hypothetical protein
MGGKLMVGIHIPVKLREIRRDVNTATPDDIISNRFAQNARYYQHKKDRPESTHSLNVADDHN